MKPSDTKFTCIGLRTLHVIIIVFYIQLQKTQSANIIKTTTTNASSNYTLEEIFDWSFLHEFNIASDSTEYQEYQEYQEHKHHIRKRDDYNTDQYIKTCKHTFDVFKDKIIKIISPYNGNKQYPGGLFCDFELIGSPGCDPAIVCEMIDLRQSEDCTTDKLIISDGTTGEKIFCGPNLGFSHPVTSRQGNYLFVTFKTGGSTAFDRLYKGFNCRVYCKNSGRLTSNPVALPESETSRKEEPTLLCGRKFNEGNNRIVGGVNAEKREFPWQAAIVSKGGRKPFCGASLINNNFILTAAHCVLEDQDVVSSVIKVDTIQILLKAYIVEVSEREDDDNFKSQDDNIVGKELVDNPNEREEIRLDIETIMVHKHYQVFRQFDNDIALIKLRTSLDLKSSSTPTPICLPEATDFHATYEGKEGTVSGWGFTHGKGRYSARVLQKVDLPIVPNGKCNELYNDVGIQITENMLCAGYLDGGKDACQGDSGGPFIFKDGDRWVQVGIVSFGDECAKKNQPGVFVHLGKFLPWIFHKTKGSIWPRSKA